ncbi:putative transcriptional regulatory protein [Fusarium oxysporum f. sp. albedinis]|nr:putative transcriptional regulatory protein [Fusarium oxysporum f. sp. albedinis]
MLFDASCPSSSLWHFARTGLSLLLHCIMALPTVIPSLQRPMCTEPHMQGSAQTRQMADGRVLICLSICMGAKPSRLILRVPLCF